MLFEEFLSPMQIDEQQLAVVALPVHPAGQTNSLADMRGSEHVIRMCSISVAETVCHGIP